MHSPLEIRYLMAAVFLAEDLSFTSAAKRLKLSQSGLSRRLNELERRCGVKLFTRDHSKVAITDAGRAFVEDAKLAILYSESAMQSAKRAHAGAVLHLTIGHSPYVDPVLVSTLFSIRLPLHPNLLLSMQSDFAPELVHGLLTAKLDLALIAHPGANRQLTMTKIGEAPFYIAVPDDHPLAAKETLSLEDMHGCTWIIFDRKVHPILHDMISRRAAEDGVIYRNNQNVLTAEEAHLQDVYQPGGNILSGSIAPAKAFIELASRAAPFLERRITVIDGRCVAYKITDKLNALRRFVNKCSWLRRFYFSSDSNPPGQRGRA
jgi:DNA-binding transcriptional LysR family regulator